MVIASGTKDIV